MSTFKNSKQKGSSRSTSSSTSSPEFELHKPSKSTSMAKPELKGSVSEQMNPRSSLYIPTHLNSSMTQPRTSAFPSNIDFSMYKRTESSKSAPMVESQQRGSFSEIMKPRISFSYPLYTKSKYMESSKSSLMVESQRARSFSKQMNPRSSVSSHNSSRSKRSEASKLSLMVDSQGARSFSKQMNPRSSVSSHASSISKRSEGSKLSSKMESKLTRSLNLSPSSICSPARTEFSTPLNQSLRFDRRESCSYEIEEEIKFRSNSSLGSKDVARKKDLLVGTRRNPLYETTRDDFSPRSEHSTCSTLKELITAGDVLHTEETVSRYADSEIGAESTISGTHFHDFIAGIRRRKTDVQIDNWKDAKESKLTSKLRKKEEKIDDWARKKNGRAEARFDEIKKKLEIKKLEASRKQQKKVNNIQKKVAKKEKSLERKIITASKVPWWKKLLYTSCCS